MKTSNPYWKPFAAAALITFGLSAATLRPALADETRGAGPEHCSAHRGGPLGGMKGDHPLPFLRGIELTEVQRDKIFELRHAQEPRERELMKQVRNSMQSLHALAGSEAFDSAKARALADSHGKAVGDLALIHAELGAKVRELLTPEQRKKADELRTKFEHQREPGRNHHPA